MRFLPLLALALSPNPHPSTAILNQVRFLPLPPSFNARPYTMLQYLRVFGVPIYHGKGLWEHKGLSGRESSPEEMVRERMLRDWDAARGVLAGEFPRAAGGAATDADADAECVRRCAPAARGLGAHPITSAVSDPSAQSGLASRWPADHGGGGEGGMASSARHERPPAEEGRGRRRYWPIPGRRLAEAMHRGNLPMEHSWKNSTSLSGR